MHLTDALELGELPEHQPERLAHALIGILGDPVVPDLQIAHGDIEEELAPARLLAQRFERALTQDRQLHLAHGALHAEQQTIVRQAWIVEPVLVAQETADEPAELEQGVPVPPVAREPRGFQCQNDAGAPLADRQQQPLEARADDTAAGAAEVVVDHHGLGPAELLRPIGERVLSPAALVVV
jgi:hypothetical protein